MSDTKFDQGAEPVRARLKWHCRRGMRELDRILEGFLEHGYASLDTGQRRCFAEFLELPDPDLHAYLVGRAVPMDPELARLLSTIRAGLAD